MLGRYLEAFSATMFPQRHIKRFSRQLILLLEEGVTIQEALRLLYMQQPNLRWARIVRQIRSAIVQGEPFSKALSRHNIFRKEYVWTIEWAEKMGGLSNLLIALRLLSDDTSSRVPRPPKSFGE